MTQQNETNELEQRRLELIEWIESMGYAPMPWLNYPKFAQSYLQMCVKNGEYVRPSLVDCAMPKWVQREIEKQQA
jgi:hypothetical protein